MKELIFLYLLLVDDGTNRFSYRVPAATMAQCETMLAKLRVEKLAGGHGHSFALVAFCGPDKVNSTWSNEWWYPIPEGKHQ